LTASPTFAADTAAAHKALDPDKDGAIDMKEALAGAKKVFKTINTDDDKTLEADELQGMLDAEGLDAADPTTTAWTGKSTGPSSEPSSRRPIPTTTAPSI
jgi:hypothetical protein